MLASFLFSIFFNVKLEREPKPSVKEIATRMSTKLEHGCKRSCSTSAIEIVNPSVSMDHRYQWTRLEWGGGDPTVYVIPARDGAGGLGEGEVLVFVRSLVCSLVRWSVPPGGSPGCDPPFPRWLGAWVGRRLGAWGVPIDRARQAASIRRLEGGIRSNPGKFMSFQNLYFN